MSDKISAFIVVLKEDVSESYSDSLMKAFSMFDGVLQVQQYVRNSDLTGEIMATSRERNKWQDALIELVKKG